MTRSFVESHHQGRIKGEEWTDFDSYAHTFLVVRLSVCLASWRITTQNTTFNALPSSTRLSIPPSKTALTDFVRRKPLICNSEGQSGSSTTRRYTARSEALRTLVLT